MTPDFQGYVMDVLIIAAVTIAFSFAVYPLLIPCAVAVGLVDRPDNRKHHNGEIPLVGGLGVFLAFMCVGAWVFPVNQVTVSIALSSLLMVKVGLLDDRHDLSVKLRIVVQMLAASVLVFGGGVQIETLGNLFSTGEVKLGWFAAPFTIAAIMTAMNAYNMIDGIDGLLGSLSLVTFLGIAALAMMHYQAVPLLIAIIMIAALLVFLARNLSGKSLGLRKVFMGDAGSMFIGQLIVCLLALMTVPLQVANFDVLPELFASAHSAESVRPVAVLWLIAIPLIDMFGIMARRILKKESPFKPDRDHLHHIFMRAGFTPSETLGLITLAAFLLLLTGLVLEIFQVPESIVALLFVGLFWLYVLCLRHAWRLASLIRSWRGIENVG